MLKSLLALCLLGLLVSSFEILEEERFQFDQFVAEHNKVYSSAFDRAHREAVFVSNLRFINEHNSKPQNFSVAINKFADLTNKEFASMYLNKRPAVFDESTPTIQYADHLLENAASSLDWRSHGVVQKVKDQAQCGSCWAFSTVSVVETGHAQKTGKLLSLSEQELVDCDTSDDGCDGGIQGWAMAWLKKNGGLCLENDYPYTAKDGRCKTTCTKKATISGWAQLKKDSEDDLMKAMQVSTVSVSMDASGRWFQFYNGGVYSGSCGHSLDHAVVGVGYGVDNGQDYWTIRNSWGSDWGEKGYFRVTRVGGTTRGECGIAIENYVVTA